MKQKEKPHIYSNLSCFFPSLCYKTWEGAIGIFAIYVQISKVQKKSYSDKMEQLHYTYRTNIVYVKIYKDDKHPNAESMHFGKETALSQKYHVSRTQSSRKSNFLASN